MKQKIFKKSNKSRIKLDLEFKNHDWWLRSMYSGISRRYGLVGLVDYYIESYAVYSVNKYSVLPVCTI